MKTVYAFDPASRIYIGPVSLDESDISPLEPGVYLIPGNCLEESPPPYDANTHRAVALPGGWQIEPIPAPEEDPAPEPQTPEQQRQALKDATTAKRWEVETGGVTLPNGVRVGTGTADQDRITTVIANAALAGVTSVDFKAQSGWVTLTIAEVQAVAAAVALHVQACFSAERAHHETIDALPEGALAGYDVNAGWPG